MKKILVILLFIFLLFPLSAENERTELYFAAVQGNTDVLGSLLDLSSSFIHTTYPRHESRTLLHLAVMNNEEKAAAYLIERGVFINSPDNRGRTALHYAVLNNNRELVSLLMDNGADSRIPDELNDTPLSLARKNKIRELLPLLRKRRSGSIPEEIMPPDFIPPKVSRQGPAGNSYYPFDGEDNSFPSSIEQMMSRRGFQDFQDERNFRVLAWSQESAFGTETEVLGEEDLNDIENIVTMLEFEMRKYNPDLLRDLDLVIYLLDEYVNTSIVGYASGNAILLTKFCSPQTLHHEVGHVVSYLYGFGDWEEKFWGNNFSEKGSDYVSWYAKTNASEDFAETFGYMMTTDICNPVITQIKYTLGDISIEDKIVAQKADFIMSYLDENDIGVNNYNLPGLVFLKEDFFDNERFENLYYETPEFNLLAGAALEDFNRLNSFKDSELINFRNSRQETPLYYAALFSSYDAIEFLVKNNADVNNNSPNGNILMDLAWKEDVPVNIVSTLIDKGANTDVTIDMGDTDTDLYYLYYYYGSRKVSEYLYSVLYGD